jgi:hypothetical protein
MSPLDLIRGRDGRMVLTKLQAATFHALLAATVASITATRLWKFWHSELTDFPNLFDATMWGLYAAVAVGHAVIDKTGAQVKDFKDRKLDAGSTPNTVTTATVTTKEVS